MSKSYEYGVQDTYYFLGLTKTAAPMRVLPGPSIFQRALTSLKSKRPTWRGAKEMLFGQPRLFAEQLRTGKAFQGHGVGSKASPGGLLRESMRAKTPMDKAFLWGFPAYEAYGALTDPTMDKARGVGGALGSALLLNATWRPLGLVGSGIAGAVGSRIGRGIGSTISGAVKETPPPVQGQLPPWK